VRATCHQVWERFPARQPTSTYVPKHVRHVTYGGDHVMAKGWHLRARSASNLSHGSSHGNVRQGTASHHANHRLSPKYGCACTWERWFRRSPTPNLGPCTKGMAVGEIFGKPLVPHTPHARHAAPDTRTSTTHQPLSNATKLGGNPWRQGSQPKGLVASP
jgi:hypothetical protein